DLVVSTRGRQRRNQDQRHQRNDDRRADSPEDERPLSGNSLRYVKAQNLITVSGPPSICSVSTNRMCRDSVVITTEWVRLPEPKNRTPFNNAPSVTPVAAKIILFPGARSSVSYTLFGSLMPIDANRSKTSSRGGTLSRSTPNRSGSNTSRA